MKMRRTAAMLAGLLSFAFTGSIDAQEPDPVRVARLIRKLGDESYQTRQQADDELARLGAASREQLTQAAASTDPETRLRASDLLRRLKIEELWRSSTLNVKCDEKSVTSTLASIAKQSPNHILPGTRFEPCNDGLVSFDLEQANYWQVLDQLCRQSKNRLRPHYDARQRGVVLASGDAGKNPLAYAGPVRLELISARRVFDDELNYKQLELKRLHTFKLIVNAMWEDRVQLTAYAAQPRVLAARTDHGEELLATEANYEWNIAGPDAQQITLELKLQPPSLGATRLETLLLSWRLMAVGDRAQTEVDLESPSSARPDGIEFAVESSQTKAEALHEVVVLTRYDHVLPEPAEAIFQENRFELADAEGHAWGLVDQSHEFHGDAIKSKLTFRRDPAMAAAPKKLRISYPLLRSQRELQLMFHDVPLPKSIEK